MAVERTYLDYNATAPLRPEARVAMFAALDQAGNPSSVHSEGRTARAIVEQARVNVAAALGAAVRSLTFTSGGTEAANLVLSPTLRDSAGPVTDLVVGAGEHPCVLEGHRFKATHVHRIPLDSLGRIELAALGEVLNGIEGRPLVALQAANNETGVIQPVREAAALAHAAGGLLVCDAVQAAGRIASGFGALEADAIFVSAHKLGGSKGSGALAFARGDLHIDGPLVRGGGQERGVRAGTENVAAIAGFGAVAGRFSPPEDEIRHLGALRDQLEHGIRDYFEDVVIFGGETDRLPNTSCFAIPGLTAETLLIALDLEGFALSSGSACSSGKVRPSHVLEAMGVAPELARCALRVSFGYGSRDDDAERFCGALEKTIRNIRARRSSRG